MPLEEILIQKIENLGPITWRKEFGWTVAHTPERKFFGGYKKIDDNLFQLLLRLSAKDFEEAMGSGFFEKFEFGKTWVVAEISSVEEVENTWPTVEKSYHFVRFVEKRKPKKK